MTKSGVYKDWKGYLCICMSTEITELFRKNYKPKEKKKGGKMKEF